MAIDTLVFNDLNDIGRFDLLERNRLCPFGEAIGYGSDGLMSLR